MIETLAYAGCFVLAALIIFQIALIAGAPIGKFAWGGQHTVLPLKLKIGSIIAVVLYLFFAAVLLTKAGVVQLIGSQAVVNIAMWVIFAYLALGIIVNAISRSKPERFVMTPVAAILVVIFLLVAIG